MLAAVVAVYGVVFGASAPAGVELAARGPVPLVVRQAPVSSGVQEERSGFASSFGPFTNLPGSQVEATLQEQIESLAPGDIPGGPAAAAATATAEVLCEPKDSDAYCVYTVQEGDTLSSIATMFGLDGATLPGWELLAASNVPDITSADDFIQPGQQLRVPKEPGIAHAVILDETAGELAVYFDVTTEAIIEANNLSDGDLIRTGDVLLIPDPQQSAPPPVLEEEEASEEDEDDAEEDGDSSEEDGGDSGSEDEDGTEEEDASEDEGTDEDVDEGSESEDGEASEEEEGSEGDGADDGDSDGDGEDDGAQEEEPEDSEPEEGPEVSAEGFIWPITARVRVTNYMSAKHPLGMDLGMSHAAGSPIIAAAPGTVSFAGGDPCCSYGYYVIIDHGNGLKTLYAHLAGLAVTKGQPVEQGQVLGQSGTTGYSTGVHLHFEVHKDGKRVDPMGYLP